MSNMSIFVPGDAAAIAVGADAVAAEVKRQMTSRGLTGKLVRNGTRGLVWLEPMLEFDDGERRTAYGPVTVADVGRVLEHAFGAGAAAECDLYRGVTEEIPEFKVQQRLTFARTGLINPLSISDYRSHGGFVGLEKALTLTPAEIVDQVTESGLRGRGGAAFPTGIKWQTVLNAETTDKPFGKHKYIVCNADEGDSGTFADRMLMEGDPYCLLEGMLIAGLAVNAEKGYIYLRSEYPHAAITLSRAIATAVAEGYLGPNVLGSGKHFDVEVRMGAGAYICGEETSLLDSLEGRRGMVRAKPPLPAIEGLFGQPTVVNNVLTLATVPMILAKSAEYHKLFGTGRSRGTIALQLAGNVRQGGLFEVPFGITVRQLLMQFAKGTFSGRPAKAVQIGGPLGAYLPASQWDTPLDYESMAAIGAMLGHGGVVIFDDTVDMSEQAQFAMEFCAIESCGKCTPCRIGAVRGAETLGKIRANEDREENLLLLEDLCTTMRDASLCAMGGLTPTPVNSAVQHFPEDFGEVNSHA